MHCATKQCVVFQICDVSIKLLEFGNCDNQRRGLASPQPAIFTGRIRNMHLELTGHDDGS